MSDYIVGSAAVLVKPIFTGFKQTIQKEFSSVLSTEATKAGRDAGKDMADAVGKEGSEAGDQFTDKLGKEVKGSKSKIDKSTKHLTKSMDKDFAKAGKKSGSSFGDNLKKAMVPIAGIIAGIGIGAQIGDTITKASDAEQSLGATEAIFKNHSDKVVALSQGAADKYGMSANSYREGSNLLGSLFKNQGVELDQLAEKTDQMVGVGADLAAQFGGTSVDAMDALSSAFKGEYDSLEKYGITMNETIVTDELKRLGQDKLTGSALALAKQEAKTNLIMKSSSDATGAAAREADTYAGSQARLTAKIDNMKEAVGKPLIDALAKSFGFIETNVLPILGTFGDFIKSHVLPVVGELGNFFRTNVKPALEEFGNFIKTEILPMLGDFADYFKSEILPRLQDLRDFVLSEVVPALETFGGFIMDTVLPAIKDMGTWLKDNGEIVKDVAGIITLIMLPALVRWGIQALVSGAISAGVWIAEQKKAIKTAAVFVIESWKIVLGWARMATAAVISGAQTAYVWLLYRLEAAKAAIAMGINAVKIVASWVLMQIQSGIQAVKMAASWAVGVLVPAAGAAVAMGINAAKVVGGWILMSVQSMVHAVRMAAAWVIAMGPVAWVIAGVIGLAAIIILNWDKIKKYTTEAFTNVSNFLRDIWTKIKTWVVLKVTELVTGAVNKFNSFKTSVTNIFNSVKSFITNTWTNIRDRVVGFISGMISKSVGNFNSFKTKITNIFNAIKNFFTDVWDNKIKPIFSALGNFINDTVAPAFQKGVDTIKDIWDSVKSFAAKPVQFMIDTVYNKGIRPMVNTMIDKIGLNKDWKLPELTSKAMGFAAGGYTGPGSKYQPAGVVHADEYVIRKESTNKLRKKYGLKGLDFINKHGELPNGYSGGGMVRPANGPYTSGFGASRGRYPHAGTDIATSAEIFAALAGTVKRTGFSNVLPGRTGNGILVDHGGGFETYYGHLRHGGTMVNPGDQVAKGQQLGWAGSTGNSTGNHLHFETHVGGKAVDPMQFLNGAAIPQGGGVTEGAGLLQQFKEFKDVLVTDFNAKFPEATRFVDYMKGIGKKMVDGIWEKVMAVGDFGQDVWGNTKDFFNGPDSDVKAAVRTEASPYGWDSGRHWDSLNKIINKESSWNPNAQNKTSSAYGLFQFINDTWGGVGGSKTSDPALQAKYGMKYIQKRYGDPEEAWKFHKANGSYADGGHVKAGLYDDGGWLQPGLTAALNKSGKPEAILTAKEWSSVHSLIKSNESRGGDTYNVTVPKPQATAMDIADTLYHQTRVARRGGRS